MTERKREKPRHLGRGLQALIRPIISGGTDENAVEADHTVRSNFPPDKELSQSLQEISIDEISPNPYQARTVWDQQELEDLAESIKANGLIQPIIVRRAGSGYQIIAGERRFRAAQLASFATVPALIRRASDEQLLELALVENIHRVDLNPIERARAYKNYLDSYFIPGYFSHVGLYVGKVTEKDKELVENAMYGMNGN